MGAHVTPVGLAVLVSIVVAAVSPGSLGEPGERRDEVDVLFEDWDRIDSPGCAAGVVRDGSLVLNRAYGMADLEHGIPIDRNTVFDIASMSKQFTAMAILLLEKKGRLSLDDDVREHLPELREYGFPITIRHLLHHTSGIRGYFALSGLSNRSVEDSLQLDEVFDLIVRQKELNFRPGTQHSYSNSNYLLLARIVEEASGKSLGRYARSRLFLPLGMNDTRYREDAGTLIPRRARGYSRRPDGDFELRALRSAIVGDGGIYTNVEDLARWDALFYEGKAASGQLPDARRLAVPGALEDGTRIPYGFGLRSGTYRGLETVSHGGTMGGYRSFMLRFPAWRLTTIVLCNQLEISPNQLAHRLADLYLSDVMEPRAGRPPSPYLRQEEDRGGAGSLAIANDLRSEYTGRYYSEELLTFYDLVEADGGIALRVGFSRPEALRRESDDTFRVAGATIRFDRNAAGHVVSLHIGTGRARRILFQKVVTAIVGASRAR